MIADDGVFLACEALGGRFFDDLFPACAFFLCVCVCVCVEVEVSLCTPVSILRPGSVHSGPLTNPLIL